jgi:hypothetical protein
MVDTIALSVSEYMGGANGDLPRREVIHAVSGILCDVVYEALLDDGYRYGTVIDAGVYRSIESLVAMMMVRQYEYDEKQLEAFADDIPLPTLEQVEAKINPERR